MKRSLKVSALAVLLSCCLVISSCNALDQVAKWLPVGLDAFAQIVAILTSAGVITPLQASTAGNDASIVNGDFGDLRTLVTQYAQASPDSKQAALDKVVVALRVLSGNLAKIEADAHISDQKTQLTVQLAFGALLTTLSAFQAQLAPVPLMAKRALPNSNDFKKSFNAIMVNGGFPARQIQ